MQPTSRRVSVGEGLNSVRTPQAVGQISQQGEWQRSAEKIVEAHRQHNRCSRGARRGQSRCSFLQTPACGRSRNSGLLGR